MKSYYLPILVLMVCTVNAYAQKSNGQTVMLGVDKSKKPDNAYGSNFANRNLSNLLQTSINADLLPDEFNKWNLGSSNYSWKNLYLAGNIYLVGQRFVSNQGIENTFIGNSAGAANTTGYSNTATGASALYNNTTGTYNCAFGANVLFNNSTGQGNTASGYFAMTNNYAGNFNSAYGFVSMSANITGYYNVAVGAFSLANNTEGHSNTALGVSSLASNMTGFGNTAIGYNSLAANTTGNTSTAVGYEALLRNTEGADNVAIGCFALSNNITGFANTASGFVALYKNSTGSFNSAFGSNALLNNTTGERNTALGHTALSGNSIGVGNTAVGHSSLANNTEGGLNTACGHMSLAFNTTGFANTALGHHAMYNNIEGIENTAIGVRALSQNTVGAFNTALGGFSLDRHARGNYNTAIGYLALVDLLNGVNNTALGMGAGTSGNDFAFGTFLGSEANAHDDIANFTAIGFGSYVFESNQVVVGNTAVTSIGGYANWSNFSDGRYKNNVKENVPGLSFITQLRPVTYTLNIEGINNGIKAAMPAVKNESSSTELKGVNLPTNIKREQTEQEIKAKEQKAKTVYTGFIAQEVEKLAKEINYDFSGVDAPGNGSGFYSLRYGDFVVPLVKAVQELNKKNEELEQRIQKLEALLSNNEVSLLNNKADKKSNESVNFSSARLEQNTPNPSTGSTTIRYYLPAEVSSASIVVSDMKGIVIKNISLTKKGSGQINIERGILASGTYSYSLLIDGKQIDSRLMIIAR